jgi:hypothetical protein
MCGSRFEGYVCQRRWHRTGKHHHKNITELKAKGERYEMSWWGDAFSRYGRLARSAKKQAGGS